MRPFEPHPWLRGSHRMTVYAWARRRSFAGLPPPEARLFDLSPKVRVLAHCHWLPEPASRPTVLLLHGLEGSSHAHYMKGLAEKAIARGLNAVRLNQRTCGGTDALSEGFYHSGLSADPRAVLHELRERDGLRDFGVIGYSLGGNVALRVAGELDEAPVPGLRAVCAVSPPVDLARCMDELERPSNRLYEWRFTWELRRRFRRKARLFPHLYDERQLRGVRGVRAFDDRFTGPHHGFRDAADYYYRASALRVTGRIRVPTLILSALDDPFIAAEPFADPGITGNPAIRVDLTSHGGHCGFVERANHGGDGYWAEHAAIDFVVGHLRAAS